MLRGRPIPLGSQEPFTMMPTSPVAYNSLGAVIGIAVLGSLVVALLALFVGYRHWQKGKEHQHLAVAYSSGRLGGSEYVMPGELARGGPTCGRWRVGSGRAGCGAPVSLPGPGRGEAGSWRGEERSDLLGRNHGPGPGPLSDRPGHRVPCLFAQMSLPATVTTTPTPATTPCRSARRSPRPPTRSVLGEGVHRRGGAVTQTQFPAELRPLCSSPYSTPPPSGSRQSALCQPPGPRAAGGSARAGEPQHPAC